MKTKNYILTLLAFATFLPAFGQGVFVTTGASTNWGVAAAWSLSSGSDADGIPDSNDDVTLNHNINVNTSAKSVRNITISGGVTLNVISFGLSVYGNYSSAGTLTGNSTLWLRGPGTFSSSSTIPVSSLILKFTPGGGTRTIAAGTVFSGLNQFLISSTGTVVNNGTMTIQNVFTIDFGTLTNGATGVITSNRNITLSNGGVLNCSTAGNIFTYSGTNVLNIAPATYNILTITNGATTTVGSKKLSGNITVNTSITLASNIQLNCNNMNITCNGTWTNNNPTNNLTNTGGTFTFGGANPNILRKTNQEVLGNVVVNCTGSFTPNSANTATYTGNFTCGSLTLTGGILDLNSTGNYTVTVLGNMSSGGGTLNGRNGLISFAGSVAQTISGNTLTFSNITSSNAAGVSTTAAENLTGTLTVNAGTFTSSTADFTLVSNTTTGVTARVAALTSGSVAGNRWIVQRRILTGAPSGTTPYWGDYSSPVTSANLSDWDNEMYLSGCSGADGDACCPIFRSVKQWNNGGANYSNVTSLIPLVRGIGYSIWTASNMSTLSAFTFDTRGTLNTGTITKTTPAATYYLLGNPYPSQILFSGLTRTGVTNFFYVLDETLQNYATWDGGSSTGTGKLAGTGGVINSSQGFLVQSTGGGSVVFNETSKTTGNVTFVRETAPVNYLKFRFTKAGKQVGMENMIHFMPGANNNFDDSDAGFLAVPFENRYDVKTLTANGIELCKNTLNLNDDRHDIPVVFIPATAGNYGFSIDGLRSLKGYNCVVLEDMTTGLFTDLSKAETYLFDCADNSERHFVLHFSKGSDDVSCMAKSGIFSSIEQNLAIAKYVFAGENEISVRLLNTQAEKTTISLYNSIGLLVATYEENMAEEFKMALPSASGVYFVSLARNGRTEVHKIIVY